MEKQHSAATTPEIIYATQHSAVEIVRGFFHLLLLLLIVEFIVVEIGIGMFVVVDGNEEVVVDGDE
ncbi:transmembrane protein, putative [Medicago truncatula]|uniref:Transmembrane protein, putative n=1 Tax=Medicago truncatula TaxID=3880 RepID=A0A072VMX1_MEDTR|nr:transmembrane protein, putative [Medicago truncatula]